MIVRLLQSKIGKDLGIFLLYRQEVVAGGAIVGNGLSVGAGVRAVVAAEASGKIVVPQVVGVHAPVHFHFRENIAQINLGDVVGCLLHQGALSVENFRIGCFVIAGDAFFDLFLRGVAIG